MKTILILEMPQYVAYLTKSHSFKRYCTIMPVLCADGGLRYNPSLWFFTHKISREQNGLMGLIE